MSSIYACPVHVDRQSTDPHRLCPLCGQRPILLRAAPDITGERSEAPEAERRESGSTKEAGPKPRQRPRAAGQGSAPSAAPPSHAGELAQDVDHAIELLSSIRDRLRAMA